MKAQFLKNFGNNLSTLNPKEMYNWPVWAKLMMGGITFVVVLGLGSVFDLKPTYDEYTALQSKEVSLKEDFVDKKKQAVNLDLYKMQLTEIVQTSDALLKQLPNRSEIEKLLIDINQAGISRGLSFELFKPNAEKINEFYAELPITIKVEGTYDSLGQFAADVGQLSRVVLLTNINLSNAKDGVITMEATAKTFRYLDPEELEKQRAERKEKEKKNKKNKKKSTPEKSSGHGA